MQSSFPWRDRGVSGREQLSNIRHQLIGQGRGSAASSFRKNGSLLRGGALARPIEQDVQLDFD